MRAAMGFARKYSDAQLAAVVAGQVQHGWTAVDTADRAAAGTLAQGLAPFDIGWRYARDLASAARRRSRSDEVVAGGSQAALAAVAGEVVRLAKARTDALERLRRSGKLRADDVASAARMVKDTAAMLRELDRGASAGAGKSKAPQAPQTGDDFVGDLAGQLPQDG